MARSCYQVTSQVNRVNPGGSRAVAAPGLPPWFLTAEVAARFPAHDASAVARADAASAVAHVDMAPESGPTLYLPHSHKYCGISCCGQKRFASSSMRHPCSWQLACGDAVFFNPALIHRRGPQTRPRTSAAPPNLLQFSSAFGRAMETVDRLRMCRASIQHCKRLAVDRG